MTVTTNLIQAFSTEKREELIHLLALRYLDGMSLRDLEQFFYDIQTDCLSGYTDSELLSEIEDNMDEDEFLELMNEIV